MSTTLKKQSISGSKEQEILMREVLGGLEEIATMLSYDPWPGNFEIIAIYPPEQEGEQSREETVVRSTPAPENRAEILSYQEYKKRLLKLSA